jgi:hypothetical protein
VRVIHFKAFMRSPADAVPIDDGRSYQFQYYNTMFADWTPVAAPIMASSGSIHQIVTIDPATYTPESAEERIHIALENGMLPSFRLVMGDTPAGDPLEVVADYWVLYVDPIDGSIHIDFGNQFKLDLAYTALSSGDQEVNIEKHVAFPIPQRLSPFLPAVWGIANEPNQFAHYSPSTHDIFVVDSGTPTAEAGSAGGGGGVRGGVAAARFPPLSTSIPKAPPVGSSRTVTLKGRFVKQTDLGPISIETPFAIEGYRTGIPGWMPLTSGLVSATGEISHTVSYDPAGVSGGSLEEFLELGFFRGVMPAIRLVGSSAASGEPQILSEYFFVYTSDGIDIVIDFGSHIYLPTGGYAGMGSDGDTITSETTMALPLAFSGNEMRNAFWAVGAATASFEGYTSPAKTLQVVAKSSGGGGGGTTDPATLEAVLMDLRAELECLRAQLLLKATTIEGLSADVASKAERISTLTTEKEAMGAVLLEKETKIADLEDTVSGYEAPATSVTEVYSKLANEVKSAKESLVENGYELTNVNFNLKTFVGVNPDGTLKLNLVDSGLAKKATADTVSALTFGVVGGVLPSTRPPGLVPNVLGLTETMARQRLQQFGLQMKAIYQTTQGSISVGSSFRQSPGAGDDAEIGDFVTVIFSKGPTQ